MRVFFLFLLYLNKAKAQISFLIPNIDTGEGMKEWSGVAQLYQTFCPVRGNSRGPSLSDTRGSRLREEPRRHGAVKIKKKKKQVGCVCDFHALEGECEVKSGNRAELKKIKRKREGSDWKKQVCGLKKNRGKRREKGDWSLSPPRLCGMTDVMRSSCVCQSRPGVFVGQFLREEEEGKGKIKWERESRDTEQ